MMRYHFLLQIFIIIFCVYPTKLSKPCKEIKHKIPFLTISIVDGIELLLNQQNNLKIFC